MQQSLIGRAEEKKILLNALASPKPELVALIGRRRVGKTYLVKHTYQQRIDFELTGLQKATKSEQLQNFLFAIKKYFPDFAIDKRPKTWLDAFFELTTALEDKNRKDKMVVFLDELPWLGTKRSGFITALGWFWNSWAINQNIALIICGSAATWMIDKVINDKGGLHNRVTKQLFIEPFTLRETEAFLRTRNIHLNRYHILQLYLVMGGIPMYLDQVERGLSAIQNIQKICFQRNGYLYKEFDRLFSSLFHNPENHIALIRTLASKRMGMVREEIIQKTKFTNGGMLSEYLEELYQSGFINIYNGYGKKNKMSLYRLTDAYSLFYLTFIEPLGPNAQTDFTKLSDLPNYKTWSGYAFENVCLLHIPQIKKALGIAGVFTTVSSFFAKATNHLAGAQIDLLIDRGDQAINLCEIKYSQTDYTVTKKDITNLATKKKVFTHHTKTKKHLFTSWITTFGVVENTNRLNYVDQVVVMDDLFG